MARVNDPLVGYQVFLLQFRLSSIHSRLLLYRLADNDWLRAAHVNIDRSNLTKSNLKDKQLSLSPAFNSRRTQRRAHDINA